MIELLGMQPNASAHGPAIDNLLVWLHWLMLILFVGWGLFYIITLIKFRAGANPKADYHGVKSHASSYLEATVAIVEVILLVGFSIPIWADVVENFPEEKDAIVVKVVAEQFAWNFHYAGPDGKFGKVDAKFVDSTTNPLGLDPEDQDGKDDIHSINQMVIPSHKPIIAKITSKDVIHSFGVPHLRVKQDAIPGMETPIWFEGIREGQFEIACSQLCGLGHYSMRGFVQLKKKADFDKWMAEQSQPEESGDAFWD